MDYLTDPAFRARFKELIAQGNRFIVLEMSGVSFCAGGRSRHGGGAGLCA
ncbi:hypothetical protein PV435_06080 [Streptomyces scabiei]|nr:MULTISPECIES: hypothetical protein [Streptomyces]MDX3275859.1 hypothetical protein [Streptomyces scabiei]MDX3847056.1 hypothetical protein [Streptomyces europaeiscabiei]